MLAYKCSECSKTVSIDTKQYYCECGGLFNLDFTPSEFQLDLIDQNEWSIFRYRKFLPLENDLWKEVSLGEGMTPIIKLDTNVLLKIDYAMPTLSFKDRGAAILIWLCKTLGINKVIQDSSGNAGNSIAAYAARVGIDCEIFVPQGTSPKKISMIESHGAKVVVVQGSRDKTAEACSNKAFTENIFYASHVYNPFFYQGTKTYIYEAYEQLGRIPDNIFVPLGNGTLFIGIITALKELLSTGIIDKMPKIYAVQSEYCDPFYKSVNEKANRVVEVDVKHTLAEGIAIGQPMRGQSILKDIYKYDIKVLVAKEQGILNARSLLARSGYYVEHTTAATYSAYLDYIKENNILGEVLIPLCGAGLKSDKGEKELY